MDCADRIAVLATDQTLEPVRMMAERSSLTAVTVRALHLTRRFDVTIRKTWPGGSREAPAYGWELREVEESGTETAGGFELRSSAAPGEDCAEAEDAYWAALEAIQENVTSVPAGARP